MINYFEYTIETERGLLNIIIRESRFSDFQFINVYAKECDVDAAREVVDKDFLIQMRKDIKSGSTAYHKKEIELGNDYVLFGAIDGWEGWEFASIAPQKQPS